MNLIESKSVVCYSEHVFVCTASFVKCSHTRQSQIRLTLGIPFPLAHSLARWFCVSLVLIYATCTSNGLSSISNAQGDSQSLCKWIDHRMNSPQAKSFSRNFKHLIESKGLNSGGLRVSRWLTIFSEQRILRSERFTCVGLSASSIVRRWFFPALFGDLEFRCQSQRYRRRYCEIPCTVLRSASV